MRLIRKRIYRAFPELDRFSDEQCRRFVGAANSSWGRRVGRWAIVALVTVAGWAVAIAGVGLFGDRLDRVFLRVSSLWAVVWGLALVGVMTAPLIAALVARDLLLRRRVRGLIQRSGACPECHYSLLGMRVGADLRVTCPECARVIDVDPALGELAADELGKPVYQPMTVRVDATTVAKRRRRHRRFLKWAAASAASFLLLLAAAYGVWWWTLISQAKLAIGERNTRAEVASIRAQMWPLGPDATSEDEFCRYVELVKAVRDHQTIDNSDGRYSAPNAPSGRFDGFTWDVLLPENATSTWEKTHGGDGTYEAGKRYALDVLRETKADGSTERLREILDMRSPMRVLETDWRGPFIGVLLTDLGYSRAMARTNAARMVMALYADDREEYVTSLEEILAGARIVGRQGTLIDALVGDAMEALAYSRVRGDQSKYPGDEWTRAVLEAIERRADRPEMWRTLQTERVGALDTVQWFFSEPSRVRGTQLGLKSADVMDVMSMAGASTPLPRWLGTYSQNRDAVNDFFGPWVASEKLPMWKRGSARVVSATGYPIVDLLVPSFGRAASSDLREECDLRATAIGLAVDRYRWATGRQPGSMDQVSPYISRKELLIDPNCGKPYRVGVMHEQGVAAGVFEIMCGDDDRPASEETAPKKPTAPGGAGPAKPKK